MIDYEAKLQDFEAIEKYLFWRFKIKLENHDGSLILLSNGLEYNLDAETRRVLLKLNDLLLHPAKKNSKRVYTEKLDLEFDLLLNDFLNVNNIVIKSIKSLRVVNISHDIDQLNMNYQYVTWSLKLLGTRNFHWFLKLVFSGLKNIFERKSLANNLKWWLDIEDEMKIKATYFFLWQKKTSSDIFQKLMMKLTRYSFLNPRIQTVISEVHNRNHEIGLHGSIGSSDDLEVYKKEIDVLQQVIKKKVYVNRYHYLDFTRWVSTINLDRASIKVDSSIGYRPPVIDTPTKTLYPTLLPNPDSKTLSNIVSIVPLFMDDCFDREYMVKIDNLFTELNKLDSFVFSVIFHNTAVLHNPYSKDAFCYFVHRCKEFDVEFLLFRDILRRL